ncbi:MAG: hypothetical protein QNJ42_13040 [Crocosphaera sp.]|nr:hypothetical protein [Crocosphaera sp.]
MLKKITSSTLIEKITQLVLLLAVIFLLGLYLWGLDKGFDITDEGYCLLGFQSLQEKLEVITSFHIIGEKLFSWMNPNIITYRLIALIITLISSTIFALGFWHWFSKFYGVKNISFNRNFILLFMVFGSFLLDYYLYRSVSYNTLNNFTNLGQASLILFTISQEEPQKINSLRFNISWLAVGFLLAFQFLIKPPSAVTFFALLSVVLLLYKRLTHWLYYLRIYSCLFLGGLLGFLFYFGLFQNFSEYVTLLIDNLFNSTGESHSSTSILSNYWNDSRNLIQKIYDFSWVYLSAFLLSLIYFSTDYLNNKKHRYLFGILLFLFVSNLIYQFYHLKLFPPTNIQFLSTYLLVSMLFLLVILVAIFEEQINLRLLNEQQDKIYQFLSICIFLFFLPFVASVGTNTGLFSLAARNAVPWLALIALLLNKINNNGKAKPLIWLFVLSLILSLSLSITHRYVYKPYRIVGNLLQQTKTTNLDLLPVQSLKFDPKTKRFLEELNTLIEKTNFQKGTPIIGLYDMPGIVYIFGGISPGIPWYFGPPYDSPSRNCFALTNSQTDKSKAILLINNKIDSINPQFLTCLKENGINFPRDYHQVGEVFNPYHSFYGKYNPDQKKVVSVWSPKS